MARSRRAPIKNRDSKPAPEGQDRGNGAKSILVVEDDDLVRRTVATQLAQLGYRVLTASNGSEALEVLDRREAVDVIFTDIVMPGGLSGRELATEAAQRQPGIKVIFTSGYDVQAPAEGAIIKKGDFLSKPYRRQDLAAKIREVLGANGGAGAN